MDLAEGPVVGGTIPGIPAVIVGRNADLGWGLTASYLDDQDVYIEKLNPENPEEYLTPAGFVPFETREAEIKVKDAEPVSLELRWTRHGPVIPGDNFGAAAVTPPGHVASLAWTSLTAKDRSVGAAIALMRSHSIGEAREAAREYLAPSMNVTMADRTSVALQMAGAAPRRLEGHTSQGRIPSPGWVAVNDWQGMRNFDANPWVVDPPSGIVVNTNNRITDAAFPDHLSFDWGDGFRIIRASKLLGDRTYHTLDSFVEIQTDTVSEAARVLLPLIARDLWYSGEPADTGTAEHRRQEALERLADWNGEMSEHTPEPLIYAAWIRALNRRLVQDELGPLQALVAAPEPGVHRAGVPQRGRGVRLVRREADDREGELRRHGAAGARRRADRARGALRAAAGELALGGRAPGGAPAPDARQRAGAAAPGEHLAEHAGGRPHAAAGADAGVRAGALRQYPRGGVSGGVRLLRSGFERVHHRHGRERPRAVAALRRSGGDLAAVGVRPDVARPGAGARGGGRGDAAAPGGAGRVDQRTMRLYLAPARLASAIRPRWPKTTSVIGRLIWVELMPAATPSVWNTDRGVGAELPAVGDAEVLQRLRGHEEQRLVELAGPEGEADADPGERVVVDLGRADQQRALAVGARGEEAELADLRDDQDALGAGRRARWRRGRSGRARTAPRRRCGRSSARWQTRSAAR